MCEDGKCGKFTPPPESRVGGVLVSVLVLGREQAEQIVAVLRGARCGDPNCTRCGGQIDLNNINPDNYGPPTSHEQEDLGGYGLVRGTVAWDWSFRDADSFRVFTTPRGRPVYRGQGSARTRRRRASRKRHQERLDRHRERSVW